MPTGIYPRKSPEERFWANVSPEPNSGCWLWMGAATSAGYGVLSVDGHLVLAHRFAFELATGRPPDPRLKVCHRCDTPPCVNGDHVFEGTDLDNHLDCRTKGRFKASRVLRGEEHPNATINEATVRSIRRLRVQGLTRAAIAKRLDLKPSHVKAILTAKSWSHVKEE